MTQRLLRRTLWMSIAAAVGEVAAKPNIVLDQNLSAFESLGFDSYKRAALAFSLSTRLDIPAHFLGRRLHEFNTLEELCRVVTEEYDRSRSNDEAIAPATDIEGLLTWLAQKSHIARQPMLTCYRGRVRAHQYSYAEAIHHIRTRASWLASELQIEPGDHIALLSMNRPELPLHMLAVMSIGAVTLLLDPNESSSDWRRRIDECHAKGIIADPQLIPYSHGSFGTLQFCRSIVEAPECIYPIPSKRCNQEAEPALFSYSRDASRHFPLRSFTHGAIVRSAKRLAMISGARHTNQLSVLPLCDDRNICSGLLSSLMTASHLVMADQFNPFIWTELIRNEEIAITSATPECLSLLVKAGVHKSSVPTLTTMFVMCGGSQHNTVRDFETASGIPAVILSEDQDHACA